MKNLNKNQWIAVSVGLGFVAYFMFSGPLMSLFNPVAADRGSQPVQVGVKVEDVVVGEGLVAEPGDALTVYYVGTLEDGTVFDSSVEGNTPFIFNLGTGEVIPGWDEGLIGMRVGGKRILVIPPEYGYGEQGAGPIPPNSTLIFEVQLLDLRKPVAP